ncbi:MAG: hypothetical protein EAZ24_12455 [Burkholderiales bacterium]|nr:MAG: hypothetical protein EAZ24_12455 [Burkholderiales bacterium]
MPGVLAAGNRSLSVSRRNGTSVSTPIAARRYVNREMPSELALFRVGLLGPLDEAGAAIPQDSRVNSRVLSYGDDVR